MAHIDEHRSRFGVDPICTTLQLAPSSYYAATRRPKCARRVRDEELKVEIRRVHAENFAVYGVRKVWRQLNREGITVPRCRVELLMRPDGLAGRVRRKGKCTTIPDDTCASTGSVGATPWRGSFGLVGELPGKHGGLPPQQYGGVEWVRVVHAHCKSLGAVLGDVWR